MQERTDHPTPIASTVPMVNLASECAAIIVAYFPEEPAVLVRLMRNLSVQVADLILVDNGGGSAVAKTAKAQGIPFRLVHMPENVGVGGALNRGFALATRSGARYVATFDQDSDPPEDLIFKLRCAHESMARRGVQCAAVGPVFFDRRLKERRYFPFYREADGRIVTICPSIDTPEFIETDALITSGTLVNAATWIEGCHYDETLFIDYTDTEWCFRVRARGYKLVGCSGVQMGHALSDAKPLRVFGRTFFRYSPLRRFYFFRNTIAFTKLEYVSWPWKKRLLAALMLRFFVNFIIDRARFKSAQMMLSGIFSGLLSEMGKKS